MLNKHAPHTCTLMPLKRAYKKPLLFLRRLKKYDKVIINQWRQWHWPLHWQQQRRSHIQHKTWKWQSTSGDGNCNDNRNNNGNNDSNSKAIQQHHQQHQSAMTPSNKPSSKHCNSNTKSKEQVCGSLVQQAVTAILLLQKHCCSAVVQHQC